MLAAAQHSTQTEVVAPAAHTAGPGLGAALEQAVGGSQRSSGSDEEAAVPVVAPGGEELLLQLGLTSPRGSLTRSNPPD